MNFDKNTVIGFSLLAILLFGYFYINSTNQKEFELKKYKIADSLNKTNFKVKDSISINLNSENNKTKNNKPEQTFVEEFSTIENELMTIKFSNKGALPIELKLKKISSFYKSDIELISKNSFKFNYELKDENKNIDSKDLFFNKPIITKNNDGTQTIEFIYTKKNNEFIKHIFVLKPNDYLFDFKIATSNYKDFFNENKINAYWVSILKQQESNIEYEKTQSQLSYFTSQNNFDYETIGNGLSENIKDPLKWISIKQQFFNNTLVSNQILNQVKNTTTILQDTTNKFFLNNKTDFTIDLSNSGNILSFQFYYGPTKYEELKKYNLELERIMNIGQGFYAFVKYINKGLVIPVFNFLKSHLTNFGIVILLLTIFLRIITAPLLYTSYLSSAKMKLLKPELDILKKQTGDDQQAYAMKQMELFRTAGVNPLGGCIPALLQIPIFLSLYYFFNSCIDLRGQSFLWATDLSSFDSIYTFSFSIPFYGNHISLFTILNVITSFMISYFGMQSAPDQNNPMLKYMPYIFPVILLGFFNSLPSALTWYYTVSNIITLLLQLIIQKYIINHDKLLLQIELKRKQPKKQSSWMQKVEQMQNAKKKIDELKNKK